MTRWRIQLTLSNANLSRRFRFAAGLLAGLGALCAAASAQVRVQGLGVPVSAPAIGVVGSISALAPSVAAPAFMAAPSLSVAVPAAAAAAGPEAPRPAAAASVQAAAAPADGGANLGRAVFDGGISDPRRAVQLETVNQFWDERNLTVARLPIVVGEIGDKDAFSRALRQNPHVQKMMIRKPGGGLRLPAGLKQFREAVAAAFAYERKINPQFDRYYAYITVTQGFVEPGQSHKRANAHTDGYPRRPEDRGEVDRMYLVSDVLPTEFFDQPFPVPTAQDFAAIHATFENAVDPAQVVVHPDYTITMMDSYTVHRSQKAEKPEFRTFVQIHFAARPYEMAQNTPNPLFEGTGNNPYLEKIKGYWREYEARYRPAAANDPIVDNPRSFFAATVDLGKLWWARTVWGNRMSLDAAEWSARRVVRESFEPKAPGSLRTFDAFASRVRSEDNPESPYSKRKRFSHALLDASLLPAEKVAAFFDGLLRGETREAEREYRRTRQPEIVSSFREEANAILAAKAAANKDYNVAGVLVAGSYAHGSAKESSDFDLVVLTRDGTGRDVPDFMVELEKARERYRWADWKDWRRYPVQNIFGVSDERTRNFVRELPVIIVTPDEALRRRLSAEAMTRPIWDASRLETFMYRLVSPFRRWYLRRELDRIPTMAGHSRD
jgi:predicted nucleotidyltransferase